MGASSTVSLSKFGRFNDTTKGRRIDSRRENSALPRPRQPFPLIRIGNMLRRMTAKIPHSIKGKKAEQA
jgi:hypothetical protein